MSVVNRPGSAFERARGRAGEAPSHARRRIIKGDRTVQTAFYHRIHNGCAETTPLRCRHRRLLAFSPAHGEGVTPVLHPVSRWPAPVERAPYFPALVAARQMPRGRLRSDAASRRHSDLRSGEIQKVHELRTYQSFTSTPCHSFRISRSLLAASAWTRSVKRQTKCSGSRVADWLAIACTRLSMFLAR
jgi:hypothetical protein